MDNCIKFKEAFRLNPEGIPICLVINLTTEEIPKKEKDIVEIVLGKV